MLKKPVPINPGSYTCFIRKDARIRSKVFLCERVNHLWVSVPVGGDNGRGRCPAVRGSAPSIRGHHDVQPQNPGIVPVSVLMEPFMIPGAFLLP